MEKEGALLLYYFFIYFFRLTPLMDILWEPYNHRAI